MLKNLLTTVSLSLLFMILSMPVLSNTTTIPKSTDTTATSETGIPADIEAVISKPMYKNATWGLRVLNLETGKELLNLNSDIHFFIGSVRKIFSVGELLNKEGPHYHSVTTVHNDGVIHHGILKGNLVLVASGDLTMGGRTLPNGKIAFTPFDHNEADSLGNALLTKTNPLAGYQDLAKQIKKSGIHAIDGDIIIDDRLFDAFYFRNQFYVSPIFVNDNVVDVIINPGKVDEKARVNWRPKSDAFSVVNELVTVQPNKKYTLELKPILPECIGKPNCLGLIKGDLPSNFSPPLTNSFPLIQTYRITKPANFARTVFIEALQQAGIDVSKITKVKDNPTHLLKLSHFYNANNQVASLQSLPYQEHAKFILKVSYNIGADTSLILLGLTNGERTMTGSLAMEKKLLQDKYNITSSEYHFVDGSGGGNTTATNKVVTQWLEIMSQQKTSFDAFFNALPILAVDGSLDFVKNFKANPTLSGAAGHVYAKPGSYVRDTESGMILKGQALAGYIHSKNNHKLVFNLVVNNVPINSLDDLLEVFQDQGEIAAILWRDQ
ncbi:D-alanyl-D-alanine carboxypeptidase [Legionella cincinnatiensis]|uniref:D-Ala-D-Ala carboxypeptidase n=1 Tax=Legionella cincinnatiensis TaxID=28085 RepID=A0A378INE0_9GAMM|nr:D-alanyl-D-alanine carboxypeptidase [Legionella cincinnatiensis]KTC93436.1 D-Ala-D-Ala carboxypeptidase [Legionella cincinnatiensis]STX36563.1 D-Ala-D-Ala carboxypeptidase [Legionella cincinnatiensis]